MLEQETLYEQARELEELIRRVQRRLYAFDPEHPVSDLPLGQLRLCSALEAGPRTVTALSEELGTSVSAVTQIADRLERTGLLERTSESSDRRFRHLRLTERGARIMQSRRSSRITRTADALSHLTPTHRLQVLQSLQGLLDAAAEEGSGEMGKENGGSA